MEMGGINGGCILGNTQIPMESKDYDEKGKKQVSLDYKTQYNEKYSDKDIREAGDILDKVLAQQDYKLEYKIHDKFKYTTMIKIVDSKTGDTIKEIPPKKILDMVAAMCKMAGLMVDEKA